MRFSHDYSSYRHFIKSNYLLMIWIPSAKNEAAILEPFQVISTIVYLLVYLNRWPDIKFTFWWILKALMAAFTLHTSIMMEGSALPPTIQSCMWILPPYITSVERINQRLKTTNGTAKDSMRLLRLPETNTESTKDYDRIRKITRKLQGLALQCTPNYHRGYPLGMNVAFLATIPKKY